MSVNAPIRVCVLEGLYAQQANFPLSLAVELQTDALRLDSAKWSMHYTDGGFRWFSAYKQLGLCRPTPPTNVEGEGNLNLVLKVKVPTPSAMRVNNLASTVVSR